jgi:hypothetical protein
MIEKIYHKAKPLFREANLEETAALFKKEKQESDNQTRALYTGGKNDGHRLFFCKYIKSVPSIFWGRTDK